MSTAEKTKDVPKIVIKKLIKASQQQVFDAWTKPEIMEKWFFPGPTMSAKVENEAKKGGSYRLEMNYAKDDPSIKKGEPTCYLHTGEYVEFDPPKKLAFTWSSEMVEETKVTVELNPQGDSTEVVVTHEFLPTEDARKKHNGGWIGCLENLAKQL